MNNNQCNILVDENGQIVVNRSKKDAKNLYYRFSEEVKAKVNAVLDKIYKLRCICCFTSLFALLGISIFYAPLMNLPVVIEYAILLLWAVGVVSGLIACPFRLLGNAIRLVVGATVAGWVFCGIGAIFGFAIAITISLCMFFFFPAVVTIRYYNNELKSQNR